MIDRSGSSGPGASPPGGRATRRLAAVLALAGLSIEAAGLLFILPNLARLGGLSKLGFNGVGGIALGITYPLVGWLLASRRPGNVIGWLFLVIGVSQASEGLATYYAVVGLEPPVGPLPWADVASWAGTWLWAPGFVLLFPLLLLFPDGVPPSRRWAPALWLSGLAGVLLMVPQAIATWQYRGPLLLLDQPPAAVAADPAIAIAGTCQVVGSFLVLPVGIAAVVGLVVRFRRAAAIERQQIKWFAAAAALEVALLLVANVITLPYPLSVLAAAVVIPLVPLATGLAILRYRLYDIDRVISRTVSWAVVTAVLAAVFVGAVVALQGALSGVTQGDTLAVAASTLVAFALFQPLRRHVQAVVDRRFDRARVDAVALVGDFTEDVRGSVALGAVTGALENATQFLRPEHVGLWLRPAAGERGDGGS